MTKFLTFFLHWFLRLLVRSRLKPDMDVVAERSRLEDLGRFGKSLPETLRVSDISTGGISSSLLETEQSSVVTVLYLHGGGFVWDLRSTYIHYVAQFCQPLEAKVIVPWYRLAPEHPYPAALDDCFGVYQELLSSGQHPKNIVLIGDSAGGNLVLATLMRIREAELAMPTCAVLISPVTDLAEKSSSWILNGWSGRDPLFDDTTFPLLRHYCGRHCPTDPLLSPYYGEFNDLPPLLFIAGERESLLDDSISIAKRASAAGTAVEMQVWKGMPHVFPMMHMLPQAKQAQKEIFEFIRIRANSMEAAGKVPVIVGKGF